MIAANFNHGPPLRGAIVREIHDFPFSTTVSCTAPDNPAHLTLVKQVVNDDGGVAVDTDWELTADGPTPIRGITGSVAVTHVVVEPGDYTLAERAGPSGYAASAWSCTDGDLNGDQLTLSAGDDAECTIVNNDKPAEVRPTQSPSSSTEPTTGPGTGPGPGSSPSNDLPNTGGLGLVWLVLAGLCVVLGAALLVTEAVTSRHGREDRPHAAR